MFHNLEACFGNVVQYVVQFCNRLADEEKDAMRVLCFICSLVCLHGAIRCSVILALKFSWPYRIEI